MAHDVEEGLEKPSVTVTAAGPSPALEPDLHVASLTSPSPTKKIRRNDAVRSPEQTPTPRPRSLLPDAKLASDEGEAAQSLHRPPRATTPHDEQQPKSLLRALSRHAIRSPQNRRPSPLSLPTPLAVPSPAPRLAPVAGSPSPLWLSAAAGEDSCSSVNTSTSAASPQVLHVIFFHVTSFL